MKDLIVSNAVMSFLEEVSTPTFESVSEYTRSIMTKMENGVILTSKGMVYSDSTIRIYKSFLTYFESFENQIGRKIMFHDVNHKFGEVFKKFLSEQDITKNTISAIVKKFKAVLGFAFRDGISLYNGSGLQAPTEKTTKIYLTKSELQKMKQAKLTDGQEKVLDVFLVQCFTGMRYSTLLKFLKSPIAYIHEYESDSYIDIVADKTDEQCVIPLSTVVIETITKYGGVMPIYSEEYVNKTLKVIGKESGIDTLIPIRITKGGTLKESLVPKYTQISTHSARRTLISLLKQEKGVESKQIIGVTGHTSEKQMESYNRSTKFEIVLPILKHEFFKKNI